MHCVHLWLLRIVSCVAGLAVATPAMAQFEPVPYKVGDKVEVRFLDKWHEAEVTQIAPGGFALMAEFVDDNGFKQTFLFTAKNIRDYRKDAVPTSSDEKLENESHGSNSANSNQGSDDEIDPFHPVPGRTQPRNDSPPAAGKPELPTRPMDDPNAGEDPDHDRIWGSNSPRERGGKGASAIPSATISPESRRGAAAPVPSRDMPPAAPAELPFWLVFILSGWLSAVLFLIGLVLFAIVYRYSSLYY